jgi:hypothetical protein
MLFRGLFTWARIAAATRRMPTIVLSNDPLGCSLFWYGCVVSFIPHHIKKGFPLDSAFLKAQRLKKTLSHFHFCNSLYRAAIAA